jgi:hypothetical protein
MPITIAEFVRIQRELREIGVRMKSVELTSEAIYELKHIDNFIRNDSPAPVRPIGCVGMLLGVELYKRK